MYDLSALVHGLILGLAVFVAPGPKDVLILREALLGQSPMKLIAIAVVSDLILICLGMLGLSALFQHVPRLHLLAQILGIGLLAVHGAQAARSALRGGHSLGAEGAQPCRSPGDRGLRGIFLVSVFNPAAWMDTVLIIGPAGMALPAAARPSFASGAVSASLIWFSLWVLGSRMGRRWMGSPWVSRLIDAVVALAMTGMAACMVADL
jgi:L-lysine exporter family protein LysE/ArgO